MAMEIPAAPKVYTHVYDNFKGVDFTNDSTNVWHRRSPSGVNMLPDESGRPFKRHGWSILLSQANICAAIGVDSCQIVKCAYFELAGVDHIVVFTDRGVIFYNGDITAVNTDPDCYGNYDRNFFFEGDGTSAFYIYGNYRMWRYGADFTLEEITEELYIPVVVYSASADGTGAIGEAYNLLYNMASVEYHDNELYAYWGTKGLYFEVDDAFKTGKTRGTPSFYRWEYDADTTSWNWTGGGASVAFDSTNINVKSDPEDGNQIVIVYAYGLLLPNNVDINSQGDKVKVFVSTVLPLDTELTQEKTYSNLGTGEFYLHMDSVERDNPQAWVEFFVSDFSSTPPVYKTGTDFDEQDAFKAIFPSTQIDVTNYSDDDPDADYPARTDTDTAVLVGGGA